MPKTEIMTEFKRNIKPEIIPFHCREYYWPDRGPILFKRTDRKDTDHRGEQMYYFLNGRNILKRRRWPKHAKNDGIMQQTIQEFERKELMSR